MNGGKCIRRSYKKSEDKLEMGIAIYLRGDHGVPSREHFVDDVSQAGITTNDLSWLVGRDTELNE